MYFKRVFRLFWPLFSQIVAPPGPSLKAPKGEGAPAPSPPVSAPVIVCRVRISDSSIHLINLKKNSTKFRFNLSETDLKSSNFRETQFCETDLNFAKQFCISVKTLDIV